ncbi:MAG TPA: chemotaxis protein CheA, partial [Candidatus Angelobacter sp.]|nr:chemotaxis protein CheA [Candidatus Angelobacter sp.]
MDFDRDKVLAAFVAESEEGLQRMEQTLLAAENDPANADLLDELFRIAHTIKGNASLLDFSDLAGFAHAVEDLLEAVRGRQIMLSRELASLLLDAVDAFRTLIPAAPARSGLSPSQEELKNKIARHVADARPCEQSAAPDEAFSPAVASGPFVPGVRNHTIRVDIGRLDQMLNCAGEIAVAQGRIRRRIEALDPEAREPILEIQSETERLFRTLQEQVMGIRMVPVGPLFQQFLRAVRDISRSHGKLARLEVVGGDVEVDTRVLEHLRDPLLHILRNAIDHGIEPPADRLAKGKNACGILRLKAFHRSGNIWIQLSDDGAGFSREQILAKGKAMGLVEEGARLSDRDIFRLVFQPGFTTAEAVSDLSGRGVGMDVVRRNIDLIRGTIDIQSVEGQGATITISLPLTLAIIDGFAVRAAGQTYVIPLEMICECLELPPQSSSASDGVVDVRGEPLPFARLRDVLGLSSGSPTRENVVVVRNGNGRAGLVVDELLGETQAIIKPLNRVFRQLPG